MLTAWLEQAATMPFLARGLRVNTKKRCCFAALVLLLGAVIGRAQQDADFIRRDDAGVLWLGKASARHEQAD